MSDHPPHPPHRTWNVDEPAARFGDEQELEAALQHDAPVGEPGSAAARRSTAFWITWSLALGAIVVGVVLLLVLAA